MSSHSERREGAAIMKSVVERLEHKACPQGLHVMVEELQWMGERSLTYEKLSQAVRAELQSSQPRIRRVAEGVYWFAEAEIPLGWSLYRDRRMLPCFYRKYPPEISWEELDRPENILPSPTQAAASDGVPDLPPMPASPLGPKRQRSATWSLRRFSLRVP